MKKILCTLTFAGLLLSLTACNTYGKDNSPKPAELTHYKQHIAIKKLWSTSPGKGVGKHYLKLNLSLSNNRVFTADTRGRISALDATNGKTLWRSDTKLPITAGPALSETRVFVGTKNAKVAALSRDHGKVLWTSTVPSEVLAAPTVSNGIVIVKTIDGQLTALSEKTGYTLWHFQEDVPSLILRLSSPVRISQNQIVAGFANGHVTALTLKTGSLLWKKAISVPEGDSAITNMVDISAAPIIKQPVIFAASYQGNVAALLFNTGGVLWQHRLSSYAGLAASEKQLFVSDTTSNVVAFNQESGNIDWKQTALRYRHITGPAVMLDTVILGDSQGYLHWLSQEDGHLLARVQVNKSGILSTPVAYDNIVFVTTKDGTITAYEVG